MPDSVCARACASVSHAVWMEREEERGREGREMHKTSDGGSGKRISVVFAKWMWLLWPSVGLRHRGFSKLTRRVCLYWVVRQISILTSRACLVDVFVGDICTNIQYLSSLRYPTKMWPTLCMSFKEHHIPGLGLKSDLDLLACDAHFVFARGKEAEYPSPC